MAIKIVDQERSVPVTMDDHFDFTHSAEERALNAPMSENIIPRVAEMSTMGHIHQDIGRGSRFNIPDTQGIEIKGRSLSRIPMATNAKIAMITAIAIDMVATT